MADVKISDLPTKTIASTDVVPVVDAAFTATSRVTAGAIAGLVTAGSLGLATVATSGSYNDLSDKPAASSGPSLGAVWALS